MNNIASGSPAPVPGEIKFDDARVGAVGTTGDTSDNDEACAIAAIEAAGFKAEGGWSSGGMISTPSLSSHAGLPRLCLLSADRQLQITHASDMAVHSIAPLNRTDA